MVWSKVVPLLPAGFSTSVTTAKTGERLVNKRIFKSSSGRGYSDYAPQWMGLMMDKFPGSALKVCQELRQTVKGRRLVEKALDLPYELVRRCGLPGAEFPELAAVDNIDAGPKMREKFSLPPLPPDEYDSLLAASARKAAQRKLRDPKEGTSSSTGNLSQLRALKDISDAFYMKPGKVAEDLSQEMPTGWKVETPKGGDTQFVYSSSEGGNYLHPSATTTSVAEFCVLHYKHVGNVAFAAFAAQTLEKVYDPENLEKLKHYVEEVAEGRALNRSQRESLKNLEAQRDIYRSEWNSLQHYGYFPARWSFDTELSMGFAVLRWVDPEGRFWLQWPEWFALMRHRDPVGSRKLEAALSERAPSNGLLKEALSLKAEDVLKRYLTLVFDC